jgi:hypothetical protein
VQKHVAGVLRDKGYPVLGEAETMAEQNFTEFMPHTKIYGKGS